MTDLVVTHKKAYGKDYFYPSNGEATAWLELLRREKTFTLNDLKLLKQLGVKVIIDPDPAPRI